MPPAGGNTQPETLPAAGSDGARMLARRCRSLAARNPAKIRCCYGEKGASGAAGPKLASGAGWPGPRQSPKPGERRRQSSRRARATCGRRWGRAADLVLRHTPEASALAANFPRTLGLDQLATGGNALTPEATGELREGERSSRAGATQLWLVCRPWAALSAG